MSFIFKQWRLPLTEKLQGCTWRSHHSGFCSLVRVCQIIALLWIAHLDCAWLQRNLWAFLQVPIILFSSGRALTDSWYFSLPLEYFKWLLKQETVFSLHDPWPLPHYVQVGKCQAYNLGLDLSGRAPILFYFWTNQCKNRKVKCKLSGIENETSGTATVCRKGFIRNRQQRGFWEQSSYWNVQPFFSKVIF